MKNNFLKYIFSIDTTSTNRTIIYILGFKIRHLKNDVRDSKTDYIKLNCPVTEIPKATGGLRQIQLANLKLVQIFDKICHENNIEYWLDFGNLLGAVRHKGFIPWDDDMDLGMIREDYEKFIKLFMNGIEEYPDLYLKYDNNGKNRCFIKLLHKKIPCIQIDLFPYDYYYKKTNEEEKIELTKLLKTINNKWYYKMVFLFFKIQPKLMIKRFKKITSEKILKGNTTTPKNKPSIFCGIDYPHCQKHLVNDFETIYPLKRIKYENIELLAPNNTDKFLTYEFGNYMELPNDCYPRHASGDHLPKEILDEIETFIK